MILNNLMQAVKKLEHIKDMIKALVLTGFKQGQVEFTDSDVIVIEQVIDFIKDGKLPEQITAESGTVKTPGTGIQIQDSSLPLNVINATPTIMQGAIIEEFDIGDGQKRQVIITPESVSDSGKEPKTHILVEDPGDDWKDGLE